MSEAAHKSDSTAEEGILEVLVENAEKDDRSSKSAPDPSSAAPNTSTTIGTDETSLKRSDEETMARGEVSTSVTGMSDVSAHSAVLGSSTSRAGIVRPPIDAMSNSKKRLCRFPGCQRVIKSQGHCQRHGARAKRCRIPGCDKQAQGTHDGMCKRHWKQTHAPDDEDEPKGDGGKRKAPPEPVGESVYEHILPDSIAFRPSNALAAAHTPVGGMLSPQKVPTGETPLPMSDAEEDEMPEPQVPDGTSGANIMPLVQYLQMNAALPAGWHRHHERRAKGVYPVSSITAQLEPWERQLALVEILLLSGGTPYANFKDLSHAWGREKGFHMILANSVCERHGEVDRKRRSDAGRAAARDVKRVGHRGAATMHSPHDMAEHEDDDEDSTPGDAVTAMCNDESAIGMMLLEEMPTSHTNADDTMGYEMAQV